MYSSSSFRWIGLSFLLLFLALALGNPVLLTSAVFFLLVALLGALFTPPSDIRIVRRLSRGVCWTGDVVEVSRELEAGGGPGVIFVHDGLPDLLELAEGNNYRVVWKWTGRKTWDLSYRVSCPKRGTHSLEETAWTTRDSLGLSRRSGASGGGELQISVVSRLGSIVAVGRARSLDRKATSSADLARAGMSTTDFIDLRRYTPGDTIRSINWKASARNANGRNELLVNRYEPEGRKATWIFLDCAGYMEVGTSLTSPMEHAIEAVNTLAWFYLSRGYTLGAYAYNSPGGFLFPDEGMRQFDRLTEMLLSVRAGGESEDLLQAVERCKSFLLRLRPETFLVSRLDVHYPRQGESAESLDRFATGVRRLSAWKSRSTAAGATKVVDVSPQAYLPPESPLEGQALSLMRWEAQPPSKALRGAGATVLHWNPLQEEFSKVLLRLSSVPR